MTHRQRTSLFCFTKKNKTVKNVKKNEQSSNDNKEQKQKNEHNDNTTADIVDSIEISIENNSQTEIDTTQPKHIESFILALRGIYSRLTFGDLKSLTLTSHQLSTSTREYLATTARIKITTEEQIANFTWYKTNLMRRLTWTPKTYFNKTTLSTNFPSATEIYLADTYHDLGYYCDPFGQLSPSVRRIHFGSNFNHPVPSSIASHVTHLWFGMLFNQELIFLPENLTFLSLGEKFNKTLSELPETLTHLYLNGIFNQPLTDLPSRLTNLKIGPNFTHSLSKLPSSLTHLILRCNCENSHLSTFSLPNLRYFNARSAKKFHFLLSVECYPNLETFIAPFYYDIPLPPLPHLFYIDAPYRVHVPSHLPALKYLVLTHFSGNNAPVNNYKEFPKSITHLVLANYNQPLTILPPCITHLEFNSSFNYPLHSLPPTLTHLLLGRAFNQATASLPPSLTHLHMHNDCTISPEYLPLLVKLTTHVYPYPFSSLPLSLKYLSVGKLNILNFKEPPPTHLLKIRIYKVTENDKHRFTISAKGMCDYVAFMDGEYTTEWPTFLPSYEEMKTH